MGNAEGYKRRKTDLEDSGDTFILDSEALPESVVIDLDRYRPTDKVEHVRKAQTTFVDDESINAQEAKVADDAFWKEKRGPSSKHVPEKEGVIHGKSIPGYKGKYDHMIIAKEEAEKNTEDGFSEKEEEWFQKDEPTNEKSDVKVVNVGTAEVKRKSFGSRIRDRYFRRSNSQRKGSSRSGRGRF